MYVKNCRNKLFFQKIKTVSVLDLVSFRIDLVSIPTTCHRQEGNYMDRHLLL